MGRGRQNARWRRARRPPRRRGTLRRLGYRVKKKNRFEEKSDRHPGAIIYDVRHRYYIIILNVVNGLFDCVIDAYDANLADYRVTCSCRIERFIPN